MLVRPFAHPLRSPTVKRIVPRSRMIGTVYSCGNIARHAHVINFTHARGVVSLVSKVLRHRRASCHRAGKVFGVPVAHDPRCFGIQARHNCRARGTADRELTVGTRKPYPFSRKAVDIRGLALLTAISSQCGSGQIVRDDEDHVWTRLRLRKCRYRGQERRYQ